MDNTKRQLLFSLMFYIFIAVLSAAITTSILVKKLKTSNEILTVDLEKIIKQFVEEESRKNSSVEEKKKHIARFSKLLNQSMSNDLPSQKIIVIKQAVVAGGRDITSSLYSHLQTKMKMEDADDANK